MARQNKQDIINIRVSKDYKDRLKQKADESSMSVSRYVINCIDKNRTNIIHNGDVLISEVCTLNAQLQKLGNRKELPVKELQNAISTVISKLNDLANEGI